jgi:hypothetical protein
MKVFLKFNRDTASARICLDHWLQIFADDDVTIICDLTNLKTEGLPKRINDITFPIVNTTYSLADRYKNCFGGGKGEIWRKAGAANLTAYRLAKPDDKFWLIDADDTMFVSTNFRELRKKLHRAEKYFDKNNLDGFSIDFYRELVNDHWSFGVALMSTHTRLNLLTDVTPEEQREHIKEVNLDGAFDVLRRKRIYNLQSFVLNDMFFHHHVDRPKLSYGLYYWTNNSIWNKIPLANDIISF